MMDALESVASEWVLAAPNSDVALPPPRFLGLRFSRAQPFQFSYCLPHKSRVGESFPIDSLESESCPLHIRDIPRIVSKITSFR